VRRQAQFPGDLRPAQQQDGKKASSRALKLKLSASGVLLVHTASPEETAAAMRLSRSAHGRLHAESS